MCGHCNRAMQTQLENDTESEAKIKGDPFVASQKIKLKICDPLTVKCPCITSFEQLDGPLSTKHEDEETMIKHANEIQTSSRQCQVDDGNWNNLWNPHQNACKRQTWTSKNNSRMTVSKPSWYVHS